MTNQDFVLKLYNREKELTRIVNYHGVFEQTECNDVLQDLYLKMLQFKEIDRYTINDEPNFYIIFIVIKNLILDQRKKENKFSHNDFPELEDETIETDGKCLQFILDEIETIDNWFDKNIIKLYITEKHSIRSLSKATGITPHFIQPIVARFKKQCKLKIKS